MNKLLASILIATVFVSCKDSTTDQPLGANDSFIGNEQISVSDTSWVYDSVNHVYSAKVPANILTDYAVSHYQVKVGYGTLNNGQYLPYTIDSVQYTATYKELEVDLQATPATDTISSPSLAYSFVVFLFK